MPIRFTTSIVLLLVHALCLGLWVFASFKVMGAARRGKAGWPKSLLWPVPDAWRAGAMGKVWVLVWFATALGYVGSRLFPGV